MIELVRLKNGIEEAKSLVIIVSDSISRMIKEDPIVLYELVMKCRDRNHRCFGNTADVLKQLALLQSDNSVHSSIRNIVLSSAEGDGSNMEFVNPVQGKTK